jgi:hypothetical protein
MRLIDSHSHLFLEEFADICRRRCKVAVANVTLIEKIGEALYETQDSKEHGAI